MHLKERFDTAFYKASLYGLKLSAPYSDILARVSRSIK